MMVSPLDESLPIDDALAPLKNALGQFSSAVLVAPPGAGKTTRAPLALLDETWAEVNASSCSSRAVAPLAPPPLACLATHFGALCLRQHRRHARLRLRQRPSIGRALSNALKVA
jgi:hypothetical protein